MADSKTDYTWVTKAASTSVIYEVANATIVPEGKFDIKQMAVSAGADAFACWVSDWLANKINDANTRETLRKFLFCPVLSGTGYVLLAKCLSGVDARRWLIPFLTQAGSSAGSQLLMDKTDLGKYGAPVKGVSV